MHIYFGAFLALAGLIATGLLIWSGYAGKTAQSAGYMGGAWFCIFLLALIAPDPVTATYKGAILFCLLLLGLGLGFYRGIPAPVAVAVGIFMLSTGVLFMVWQAHTTAQLPTPLALLALALAGLVYWRLYANKIAGVSRADPRGDIIVLLFILMLATWQAIELWTQQTTYWSAFAMLGALVLWAVVGIHMFGTMRRGLPRPFRVAPTPRPTPILPSAAATSTPAATGPDTTLPIAPPQSPPPSVSPFPIYTLGVALISGWFLALSVWTYFDLV